MKLTSQSDTFFEESTLRIIKENGLSGNEDAPPWLVNFFDDILKGRSTTCRFGNDESLTKKGDSADVWNFLADLEDLIPMRCNDYGEAIAMIFRPIGIFAIVSLESGSYRIESSTDPEISIYAASKLAKTRTSKRQVK